MKSWRRFCCGSVERFWFVGNQNEDVLPSCRLDLATRVASYSTIAQAALETCDRCRICRGVKEAQKGMIGLGVCRDHQQPHLFQPPLNLLHPPPPSTTC